MTVQLSRFMLQTVLPGEEVVAVARFHFFYTFLAVLAFLALSLAGWGLSSLLQKTGTLTSAHRLGPVRWVDLPIYLGMLAGALTWLILMLRKWTTEVVLTNKRFLFKRGIIAIRVDKMSVFEINYTTVMQSILGNLMNYGSIYVYTFTLDDQNISLPDIAAPHYFSSEIERIKKMGGVEVGMTPLPKSLSRFMRKTLLPDERVIRDARFHGFYTFTCFFAMALCVLVGAAAQYLSKRYLGQATMHPTYAGLIVGVWMFFWMMMKKWTTEIILTDHRLLYKRGFFQVNIDEVDIEQLASDHVQQSLLGRMLDYGRIHIRCVEASDIILPDIAHPYEFRNALEQEKHVYREHYMKVERLRRHGAQPGDSR